MMQCVIQKRLLSLREAMEMSKCFSTVRGSNYLQSQEATKASEDSQRHKQTKSELSVKNSDGKKYHGAQYCLDIVRKHDYEGYLCSLLLPGVKERSAVLAVKALNTEISTIRDHVSQKEIGVGRLMFWRTAIDQIYSKGNNKLSEVPHHPCIKELSRAVKECNISKKWLVNLVDSRERMMSDAPFKDMRDLENYCDLSNTSILYLGLEIYGIKNLDIDHAASHMGKAIGLTNFVRSLPYHTRRKAVLIPSELMQKHKVSQEDVVRGKKPESIREIVFEIAGQAHVHYEKARNMKKVVGGKAVPVFLAGVPSLNYLKKLQKADFNPFTGKLQRRDGLLPFKLYYSKLLKSYG